LVSDRFQGKKKEGNLRIKKEQGAELRGVLCEGREWSFYNARKENGHKGEPNMEREAAVLSFRFDIQKELKFVRHAFSLTRRRLVNRVVFGKRGNKRSEYN